MLFVSKLKRLATGLKSGFWVLGLVGLLSGMTGCETGRPYVAPNGGNVDGPAPGLELSVGEKVSIRFAGLPTPPPPHEERIREDGTIHPPYLNTPIRAEGLTPPQLQEKLLEAYVPNIFTTISITVITEDRLFTINGEVVRSGRYPYVGETTAVEAISQAGGLTVFARKQKISIIRGNGSQIEFNYEKARKDSRYDPIVIPGDIIDVPRRLF
jgi:polysaccharide export outer membrane protein